MPFFDQEFYVEVLKFHEVVVPCNRKFPKSCWQILREAFRTARRSSAAVYTVIDIPILLLQLCAASMKSCASSIK